MRISTFAARMYVVLAGILITSITASAQVLSVTPTTVTATGTAGAAVASQSVNIRKSGKSVMKWTVSPPSASWLSVSPLSGTNSGTLTVSFPGTFSAGTSLQASFVVNANGGQSQVVTVNLTVGSTASAPPPVTLTGLSISGPTSVTVGQTAQYTAIAQLSDGSTKALTSGTPPSWSTSNSSIATITQLSGVLTAVGAGTVAVQAIYGGIAAQMGVNVAATSGSQIPALLLSCPANISTTSSSGSPVVVTYSATTSGGVAPVTVTGSPASGSSFPVGTTPVSVTANSSDGQTASCGFSVTVTYSAPPPPPPPSGVGPQSTITCPAGAVDIFPGANIQDVVNQFPGTTTFCLKPGIFSIRSAITPKTGNTFVGEYGAILDGSNWVTTDTTQAAFRSHNQDIDYVTIRNLVIRKMPQRGIHAYYYMSDHWTVEYNEIASSVDVGIVVPPSSLIRNNYIHHNTYAGYMGPSASNSTFDSNEIAYNGWEQKVGETTNVTFRNNFVHHNVGIGIWYDSHNTGALIEGNRVEDNGHIGIFYEISSDAIIRNNTIQRNAEAGIMLSVSKNVQVYNNTLDSNFRGITYYLNCPSMSDTTVDLANNTAHDNAITVGTQSGAFASLFSYGSCTSTQVAPYLNGSKNLTFSHNTYRVPSTSGRWWVWGVDLKWWSDWQGLGQDVTSTMSQ